VPPAPRDRWICGFANAEGGRLIIGRERPGWSYHRIVAIRKFKLTGTAGLVGLAVVLYGFIFQKDLFDHLLVFLEYLEHLEIDEFLIAGVLLLVGLVLDLTRIRRERDRTIELQDQRLRVLRATMRTVQDIVNNFLNNLLLFRLEAEESKALSDSSLELLDSLITETGDKLKTLGDVDSTREVSLAEGLTGIDYQR